VFLRCTKPVFTSHIAPSASLTRQSDCIARMSGQQNASSLTMAIAFESKWLNQLFAENDIDVKSVELHDEDCTTYLNEVVGVAIRGTDVIHGELVVHATTKLTSAEVGAPEWVERHKVVGEDLLFWQATGGDEIWAWHLEGQMKYDTPVHFPTRDSDSKWLQVCNDVPSPEGWCSSRDAPADHLGPSRGRPCDQKYAYIARRMQADGETLAEVKHVLKRNGATLSRISQISKELGFRPSSSGVAGKSARIVAVEMFEEGKAEHEVRAVLVARWSGSRASQIIGELKKTRAASGAWEQPPRSRRGTSTVINKRPSRQVSAEAPDRRPGDAHARVAVGEATSEEVLPEDRQGKNCNTSNKYATSATDQDDEDVVLDQGAVVAPESCGVCDRMAGLTEYMVVKAAMMHRVTTGPDDAGELVLEQGLDVDDMDKESVDSSDAQCGSDGAPRVSEDEVEGSDSASDGPHSAGDLKRLRVASGAMEHTPKMRKRTSVIITKRRSCPVGAESPDRSAGDAPVTFAVEAMDKDSVGIVDTQCGNDDAPRKKKHEVEGSDNASDGFVAVVANHYRKGIVPGQSIAFAPTRCGDCGRMVSPSELTAFEGACPACTVGYLCATIGGGGAKPISTPPIAIAPGSHCDSKTPTVGVDEAIVRLVGHGLDVHDMDEENVDTGVAKCGNGERSSEQEDDEVKIYRCDACNASFTWVHYARSLTVCPFCHHLVVA